MEKVKKVEDLIVYQKARKLFDEFMEKNADILSAHYLGKELARQQIRSLDSICTNLEEGISRKHGKEFKQFIRNSLGSTRESKGRYYRCSRFLSSGIINERARELDEISAMLYRMAQNITEH